MVRAVRTLPFTLEGRTTQGCEQTGSLRSHLKKTIFIPSAKKADAFMNHYASVSSLNISRQQRRRYHLRLRRLLDSADSSWTNDFPEFTMQELKTAISKMRRKGAPGPDDINPAMLKELGPVALNELLALCNITVRTSNWPQMWKSAIMIPLLKANKPACDLGSYRGVSLTSCPA